MVLPRVLLSRSRSRIGTALCLTAAAPFAYNVRESPVSDIESDTLEPPIAANERAVKTWEVTGGGASINRVELRVPGLAYVTADGTATESDGKMASVRVSGDSKELVECVKVVPLPPNGVQLQFKSKECAHLRGHLLTSLRLAKEGHVNDLKASGGGTVAIEDGVLVTDCEHASVHVSSEGSGDVYVTSKREPINLRQLRLSILGSGSFQFVGPDSIKVRDQFLMEIAGSGKMKAFAGTISTSLLKASIAGSGTASVVSRGDGFVIDKLKTSIAGSGKATYIGNGKCRVQRCSVTGSGKVLAQDVVCDEASVSAIGEADVTWHVTDKITASGWSSTKLRYVNALPKVVEGKSMTIRPATPASSDGKAEEPVEAPAREAAFSAIEAVYETKSAAIENATNLSGIRRFLQNAFIGGEKTITINVKTEPPTEETK